MHNWRKKHVVLFFCNIVFFLCSGGNPKLAATTLWQKARGGEQAIKVIMVIIVSDCGDHGRRMCDRGGDHGGHCGDNGDHCGEKRKSISLG